MQKEKKKKGHRARSQPVDGDRAGLERVTADKGIIRESKPQQII